MRIFKTVFFITALFAACAGLLSACALKPQTPATVSSIATAPLSTTQATPVKAQQNTGVSSTTNSNANQPLAFPIISTSQDYITGHDSKTHTYQYMRRVYISSNPKTTVLNIQHAAAADNATAALELATLYNDGYWLPKNPQLAIVWLHKSALHDNAIAQYHLGLIYLSGKHVKKNPSLAFAWLQLAAKHGLSDARVKVDRLITHLSASQLQNASNELTQLKAEMKTITADHQSSVLHHKLSTIAGLA